ncbi:MAG: dienelactone hydrolase family protein [Castellaniella sp.]
MTSMIEIPARDGKAIPAYFAHAKALHSPGLVVIPEIFGINASMRQAADDWSAAGFHVVVPDIFWRQEAGLALEPRNPDDFARGVALMQAMDEAQTVQDLEQVAGWLAEHCGHRDISALGYCLGGRLVVHMAAGSSIRCAVSYYGVGLDKLVPGMPGEGPRVLLHIAEKDAHVPAEARQVLLDEVARRSHWEAYVYPGCDHAFARPGGEHEDSAAAATAKQRTLAFLAA